MAMHSIAWWPTAAVVTIATITDLRRRRIPNWLVIPYMAIGLLLSGIRLGLHGLVHSLGGIALGLAVFGVLAIKGGMGMGDVKLCAAIGAWIWAQQLFVALIFTAIAGGILALVWASAQGFLSDLFGAIGRRIFGFLRPGAKPGMQLDVDNPLSRRMPYAPAIAIGTLISFFSR